MNNQYEYHQYASKSRSKRVEELENENRRLQEGVVSALVKSNELMAQELELLKNRMQALEAGGGVGGNEAVFDRSAVKETAVVNNTSTATILNKSNQGRRKSIKWAKEEEGKNNNYESSSTRVLVDGLDDSNHSIPINGGGTPPPMRKIKFVDHHNHIDKRSNLHQNQIIRAQDVRESDSNNNNMIKTQLQLLDNDDDQSFNSSTTSTSSEAIAFSGWARVFFQARHHRTSTQITSNATSSPSQDTYLHLSISSTSNVLCISDTTTNNNNTNRPLIDPPIPLKYFHAVKLPNSHSGAALFLKHDTRRLRKYMFRFEFINRTVHQPPQRYLQFVRSGNAAKKSMRSINSKMKSAFRRRSGGGGGGEERRENLREDKKKASDAFKAHLGTLDELLRESDDLAERFVECVNRRNEEEEELMMLGNSGGVGGVSTVVGGRRRSTALMGMKRTRPPPPYWGSGFNRPSTNNDEDDDDDDIDSESDFSDDDEELYYDDDNDDETLFDRVQVSTEQTLESLWNQIVK